VGSQERKEEVMTYKVIFFVDYDGKVKLARVPMGGKGK
jgi:hypothetical protein